MSQPSEPRLNPPPSQSFGGAFLSYLVPGLGQVVQGRVGKGLLFMVCLLGLFHVGEAMGGWQNVYLPQSDAGGNPIQSIVSNRWHFAGQFWIGVSAWPAIWQFYHTGNFAKDDITIVAQGVPPGSDIGLKLDMASGLLVKRLELIDPQNYFRVAEVRPGLPADQWGLRIGDVVRTANGAKVVGLPSELTKELAALPPGSKLEIGIVRRPFWPNYQKAPSEEEINEFLVRSDKTPDLGWIYTVIAGMLNILVIYDAFAGPAYGASMREARAKRPAQEAVPA